MHVTNVTGHRRTRGLTDDIVTHPGPHCGATWLDVLMYFKRILKEIGINDELFRFI